MVMIEKDGNIFRPAEFFRGARLFDQIYIRGLSVNDVKAVINKLHACPALDGEEVIASMMSSLHYFQQKATPVLVPEVDVCSGTLTCATVRRRKKILTTRKEPVVYVIVQTVSAIVIEIYFHGGLPISVRSLYSLRLPPLCIRFMCFSLS
jgi:hypothetical protein